MEKFTNTLSASLEEMLTSVANQAAIKAVELHEERLKASRPPVLWNKRQARDYLKVSYNTLEKFIEKGLVNTVTIGKTVRFDAEELKAQVHEIRSHLYER